MKELPPERLKPPIKHWNASRVGRPWLRGRVECVRGEKRGACKTDTLLKSTDLHVEGFTKSGWFWVFVKYQLLNRIFPVNFLNSPVWRNRPDEFTSLVKHARRIYQFGEFTNPGNWCGLFRHQCHFESSQSSTIFRYMWVPSSCIYDQSDHSPFMMSD